MVVYTYLFYSWLHMVWVLSWEPCLQLGSLSQATLPRPYQSPEMCPLRGQMCMGEGQV